MANIKTYQLVTQSGTVITFANRKAASTAAAAFRTSPQAPITPGSSAPTVRQVSVKVVTKQSATPAPTPPGKGK